MIQSSQMGKAFVKYKHRFAYNMSRCSSIVVRDVCIIVDDLHVDLISL